MTTHTILCIENTEKRHAARIAFDMLWPNACQSCNGAGAHTYRYDPSPAGVSLGGGYLEDCDPCPECIEKGICPRCGKTTLDDTGEVCSACHWQVEKDVDPAGRPNWRPPEWECYCYEQEFEALQEKAYEQLEACDINDYIDLLLEAPYYED